MRRKSRLVPLTNFAVSLMAEECLSKRLFPEELRPFPSKNRSICGLMRD
jgi:hypothetical protein